LYLDVDPAHALARCERALAIDKTCEPAYNVAMEAASALGRRDLVLRLFERCTRALVDEFGLQPMPETVAQRERFLSSATPPAATTSASPSNECTPAHPARHRPRSSASERHGRSTITWYR
jgi:DNA-binding SARP family transcriptional activator